MSRKIPVAIIMGSDSDLPKMAGAVEVLEEFGIPYHIEVVSAHRTPHRMIEFADEAAKKGFEVIIAGAGGAAHLPGMVASATTLPVIGVPVEVGSMQGLDALLSIVQMPRGVPVATMAVDNSANAGLLAVRILALRSAKLRDRLEAFNKSQKSKVKQANQKLKQKLKNLLNKS